MTMIEGMRPAARIAPTTRQRRATGAPAFAPAQTADEPDSTAAALTAAPVGLDLLLGLQESQSAEVRDRAARGHGQNLLAALRRLQLTLLGGKMEKTDLHRLAALSPDAADPQLRTLVQSIALRARVELAKAARR